MTGPEFLSIRQRLGLTAPQWGRALGYEGDSRRINVLRYERGEREIPLWIARLAEMYRRYGVPEEFLTEDGTNATA